MTRTDHPLVRGAVKCVEAHAAATPLAVLRHWPADRRVLMLHSGRLDPRWSRWSVLAQPEGDVVIPAESSRESGQVQRPLRALHRAVDEAGGDCLWIVSLSYDLGRCYEALPATAMDDRAWPWVAMARCPGWLVHDALEGCWYAGGTWNAALPGWVRDVMRCRGPACDSAMPPVAEPASNFTPSAYRAAVEQAKEYIAAGDVYQVNLAQRFTAAWPDPSPVAARALYQRLAAASPAWYGAYLELPQSRFLLSTSPELFLAVSDEGRVVTRPIKGTRAITGTMDSRVAVDQLARSEKDQAELNMIVDLLRNDLGRVCRYGSVRVTQPRVIEVHPTIAHGVATIAGELHPRKSLYDLLRATLPGGSITGAPKIRAMQIIEELEGVRRGPYCGAIGWIRGGGGVHERDAAGFNIAIRTIALDAGRGRGTLDFSVGGGIVSDSDPQAEYQETLDKAAALFTAIRSGV
jgi:para-aminobenzoate synthetase component 1